MRSIFPELIETQQIFEKRVDEIVEILKQKYVNLIDPESTIYYNQNN